jgi:hypothetical protein
MPRSKAAKIAPVAKMAPEVAERVPDVQDAPEAHSSPASPARVTKLGLLIACLTDPDGARLEDLCQVTGWQAHSVRGAIAGTLKQKGFVIVSEKAGTGPRRYAIKARP